MTLCHKCNQFLRPRIDVKHYFFGKQVTEMLSSSIGKFLNAFKHLCRHLLLILLNSDNFLNELECFKISFTKTAVAPLLITLQIWFTSQKKPQVISFLLRCEPALWHK